MSSCNGCPDTWFLMFHKPLYFFQDIIFESAEEAAKQTNLTVGGSLCSNTGGRSKEQRMCFGTVLLGPNLGEDTPAETHWQEMMKVPRRPVAQWHALI